MADSQRMTLPGKGVAGMEKQPRSFWEPGAKPRQSTLGGAAQFGPHGEVFFSE